jgi:hypothetical protein
MQPIGMKMDRQRFKVLAKAAYFLAVEPQGAMESPSTFRRMIAIDIGAFSLLLLLSLASVRARLEAEEDEGTREVIEYRLKGEITQRTVRSIRQNYVDRFIQESACLRAEESERVYIEASCAVLMVRLHGKATSNLEREWTL